MTRRKMIAVTVALTTALLALGWIVKTRLASPPAALLRVDCVPGETHAFAVDYESHGRLLDSTMGLPVAGPASTQAVDVTVRGRAVETCIERDAHRRVFSIDFADIGGEVVTEPGSRQAVAALLLGTTFVELQADGAVQAIHFARGMPELGQNIVRDLLSHRSMKLSPRAAQAWQTEETSLDGSYPATYRIERVAGDGVQVTKQRSDAPASRTQLIERPTVHHLAGTIARIRLDRAWLRALDSTTRVELVSGKKVVATTTTRVVLRGVPAEPRGVDGLRTLLGSLRASGAPVGDLAASEADRRLDDRMQREELKDATWATLWDRARDPQSDEARVFLQLRALFKLHPEACPQAAAALAALDSIKDRPFMILASALASTGTPEAQAALRAAIEGARGKRDHQEVLLAALGGLAAPERATEEYVRDVALHGDHPEARGIAQLALGSMARTLGEGDAPRAAALVTEALQRASGAASLDDRLVAIQTLGNTGSRRALDTLRTAASDPSFVIRQSAASALRFLDGLDVEHQLLALALSDPEPSVRAEAATSLRQRVIEPATFAALAMLLRREPSDTVRMALISLIAAAVAWHPDAVDVLAWSAEHDVKTEVRRYAQLALVQARAPS